MRFKLFPFFLVSVAFGSSFYPRPFPNTVEKAPHIVRGEVLSQTAEWLDDGRGGEARIYTLVELEVSEVIKGSVDEKPQITLKRLGGEKDGVGLKIPGSAVFKVGEDVVVLLGDAHSDGTYPIQTMMMGRYSVRQNSAGEDVLEGPGLLLGAEQGASSQDKKEWTLDRLKDLVRSQAGGTSSDKPNVKVSKESSDSKHSTENRQKNKPAVISGHEHHSHDSHDHSHTEADIEDSEESSSGESTGWLWWVIAGGAGLLLGAGLLRFLLRSR